MFVLAIEFKLKSEKYLMLSETEDVFITQNGKVVAKLTNPNADRVEMAKSLFGIIPADITVEEAREERIYENRKTTALPEKQSCSLFWEDKKYFYRTVKFASGNKKFLKYTQNSVPKKIQTKEKPLNPIG